MAGTISIKTLVEPTLLTGSAATLYTATGVTAQIREIVVCNTTGSDATFFMSKGTDAAGTRWYSGLNIPAHDTVHIDCKRTLADTNFIQAYSGTASALTLTVEGLEKTT
jgi:hypothetical protein